LRIARKKVLINYETMNVAGKVGENKEFWLGIRVVLEERTRRRMRHGVA
jgi:hypothetical protein